MSKAARIFADGLIRLIFLVATMAAVLSLAACSTTGGSEPGQVSSRVHKERNPYGQVAFKSGDSVTFKSIPSLRFTGKTATAREIRQFLAAEGIRVQIMFADGEYAQVEAASARDTALWLKRALFDLDYTYYLGKRDCDQFARIFRTFPDFFAGAAPGEAQAAAFGIYAKMDTPFAGVSDGYHALCVAWTDAGIIVFEPQGIDLIYQLLTAWANKSGITHGITD